jgi:hypothetical protein
MRKSLTLSFPGSLRCSVAAVVLAAALPGCGLVETELVCRVKVETSQWERSTAGPAPRQDGAADGVLRLRARETLWLAPGRMRSETYASAPDESGEIKGWWGVQLHDFQAGEVWVSAAGGPYYRRSLGEVEYESERLRRRNAIDFVDAYVRLPGVRELEGIEGYTGDLAVTPGGQSGGRSSFVVAAEPGVEWRVKVERGGDEGVPDWVPGLLLCRLLGQTAARSERLARALGGMPVAFAGRVVPGGETETVIEHRVISWRLLDRDPRLFLPPAPDRERARAVAAHFRDSGAILEALRRPEEIPEAVSPLGLVLELEPFAARDPRVLSEVLDVWRETRDSVFEVELLRLGLRVDPGALWAFLRSVLRRQDGERALAAAEALIAEGHPRAVSAVLELLERRREFPDLGEESIVSWGVKHLRVLSGLSLEELAAALSEFWLPQSGVSEPEGLLEALAGELDFWLRWGEGRIGVEGSRRSPLPEGSHFPPGR